MFEYISLSKELGSRLPEPFSSAVLDFKIVTWICFRSEPFLFIQVFFHFLNCFCYLLFEYILPQKELDLRLPEAFSSDVLDFKIFPMFIISAKLPQQLICDKSVWVHFMDVQTS